MLNLGNVLILGDSYSTFIGFIPEQNVSWYFPEKPTEETDVLSVEKTWWKQLLDSTESTLILNESYSGTTVCNTGYDGNDYTEISFIGRFKKLVDKGFFESNKIDTFFIFGGTNDSWANSPVGLLKYDEFKVEDSYKVLPAFCYLLKTAKSVMPSTRIINIMNCDLKTEIEDGFKAACQRYGVEFLQLKDIEKCCSHPNSTGMKQIKEQIEEYLKK